MKLIEDYTDKLKKQNQLKSSLGKVGTCLVISIYNANPKIFNSNIDNAAKFIDSLDDHRSAMQVCQGLNRIFMNKIFCLVERKYDIENIEKKIDNGIAVPFWVIFRNQLITENKEYTDEGHAITILGYDEQYFYCWENVSNVEENPILEDISIMTFNLLRTKKSGIKNLDDLIDKYNHSNGLTQLRYLVECIQLVKRLNTKIVKDRIYWKFDKEYLRYIYKERSGYINIDEKIKDYDESIINYDITQLSDLTNRLKHLIHNFSEQDNIVLFKMKKYCDLCNIEITNNNFDHIYKIVDIDRNYMINGMKSKE